MTGTIERRFAAGAKKPTVAKREDGTNTIQGYAAVFRDVTDPGTQYELNSGVWEEIAPTAFDRALRERQDTLARYNHDTLLARASSGTLRMKTDDIGLFYEIDVPPTQAGRDLVAMIDRGDIAGSSFAFRATSVTWMDSGDSGSVRQINDCDLVDVGPVDMPAYKSTTTGVRAADAAGAELVRQECEEWRASRGRSEKDKISVALAMAEADSVEFD